MKSIQLSAIVAFCNIELRKLITKESKAKKNKEKRNPATLQLCCNVATLKVGGQHLAKLYFALKTHLKNEWLGINGKKFPFFR